MSKNKGLSRIEDYLNKRSFKNILSIVIFSILLFVFIANKIDMGTVNLKLGDISTSEIRANKEIVDRQATEKLKKDIRDNSEKVFRQNPSIQTTMKTTIGDFIYSIKKYKKEDIALDDKIELISKETNVIISKENYKTALSMEDRELDDFKMILDDLVGQIMGPGIEEKDIDKERNNIKNIFSSFNFSNEKKDLGINLLSGIVQPNKFYDEEETESKLKEKLDGIEPVMIKEQQVIVRKDEKVDQESLDILKDLGMIKNNRHDKFNTSFGIILLIILLGLVLYGYVRVFNKKLLEDNRLILLLLIIISTLVLSDLMSRLSPYIMPVSVGAMLISLLIDIRLGIIVNVFISFILSFTLKLDSGALAMYLISGSLGSFVIKKNQQRYDLMITGILIGLINIFTIISFGLIKNLELREIIIKSMYGFFNGIVCGVVTIGSLPLWENGFKIVTPLRLMELSNPNQPLLKRLLLEAPGTYHHSIVVGNLSERAAEELGADPLLARTGAYYHDIGKLKRPYFFKENQIGIKNPHDDLTPEMSARIIINHVRDGVELAKKNKLPREIIDILEQHHGRTKVMYFYYQAKEKDPDVSIEDFIYDGPKPRTKEAAIVMMADSTEAAVRSISNPDKEKIEDMVRKVISGKLDDNQFSQCDINFKDIDRIEKVFISTFMGIFHERIEYPDMDDLK